MSVIDAAIKPLRDALAEKRYQLADDIYNDIMGPYLDSIKALPKEFFGWGETFAVSLDGESTRRIVNRGDYVHIEMRDDKPLWHDAPWRPIKQYSKNHEFTKRHRKLRKERDEIDKKQDALSERTIQVLDSVTTVKKLLLVWPEAKDYLPPGALVDDTKKLPAVVSANLTNMIHDLQALHAA